MEKGKEYYREYWNRVYLEVEYIINELKNMANRWSYDNEFIEDVMLEVKKEFNM